MEVAHYGWQYIGHVALYVLQLNVISLIDGRVPRYYDSYIRLHAAPYSCCFQFSGQFSTVHLGSYFRWLHLHHRGELCGVWAVVGSQRVASGMKCPLFCSILFHSHLAEVFVEPPFAAMEVKR